MKSVGIYAPRRAKSNGITAGGTGAAAALTRFARAEYDRHIVTARAPADRGVRCPTCGLRTSWRDNPQRPFCSLTCRLIDLGGWLDERYRIPTRDDDAEQSAGVDVP